MSHLYLWELYQIGNHFISNEEYTKSAFNYMPSLESAVRHACKILLNIILSLCLRTTRLSKSIVRLLPIVPTGTKLAVFKQKYKFQNGMASTSSGLGVLTIVRLIAGLLEEIELPMSD